MKTSIFVCSLLISFLCAAEIQVYKSTDNSGINKKEQIEVIEGYLSKISTQLVDMESKLDTTSKKILSLEKVVSAIKEQDLKKINDQLGEKKEAEKKAAADDPVKENAQEIEKLKVDILALKNDDIEKIRLQIQGLNAVMNDVQTNLKMKKK